MKKNTPLSDRTNEIVLGSLLGDGSIAINKDYKNPRFSFRHSALQKEYFFWKVEQLHEISGPKKVWEQSNASKNEFGKEKLRYQSRATPLLNDIYALVTKNGKKRVTRKWLNQLSPLALAIWWCDDGSLISNTRKGVLCTDGFLLEEVKIIQKYLKVVWDVQSHISEVSSKNSKKYYRIYIRSATQLTKFLSIMLPHIPVKSMLYKFLVLYNDSKLQQRWISEIEKASVFDKKTIEEVVALRKKQLKSFRE